MRTTIDLDPSILRALKERQSREHKTLGQLVSELLAPVLAREEEPASPDFVWRSAGLQAHVDLEDKEAVWRILDEKILDGL